MEILWSQAVLPGLYALLMLCTSILSFQSLALALLYLFHRNYRAPKPPDPETWPRVTVQLPIYNERFVVQRLIDAVCALDYPPEALTIQVLDDSTDDTTHLAQSRVETYRRQGVNIDLLHRDERTGFKGGALANGLRCAAGDFIAVIDADFIPPPDLLRRLIPCLIADPGLGMAQARWTHLNAGENLITRGQALSLDGHFAVIQPARSRAGLLFNFNGSGGVWRRDCIEDAGGWSGRSLTEDLDLSYRAQLKGWRMAYLSEVVVPGQIPGGIAAYKQQQYRWVRGGIQALMELAPEIWRAPLSLAQRIGGLLHLASYLAHPLMLIYLLLSLPIVLTAGVQLPALQWMLPAGFGPPLLILLSQWDSYPDWKRRMLYFPVQICLSVGVSLNNSLAVAAALRRKPTLFGRTPKFDLSAGGDAEVRQAYALRLDWTVWGELALSIYALATALFSLVRLPAMAAPLAVIALAFGFVGGAGLWQGRGIPKHAETCRSPKVSIRNSPPA